MNIHRWRKLEGSDPSTYEMIQKIHTLQRRLIVKTEEVKRMSLQPLLLHPLILCVWSLGGGERVADPGEGEAVHGVEADPSAATGARGGGAVADLPADTEGEDKTDEGKRGHRQSNPT